MAKINLERNSFRYGKCNVCQTPWEGQVIPKHLRKKNNGRYKWSRLIEVYREAWICPDCDSHFDYETGELMDV